MPITTAPSIWLRPASGLMIRPASMTVTTRLTRRRAISGCQVTSTKWQPNEWVENFGFGLPNVAFAFAAAGDAGEHWRRRASRQTARRRRAVGFHKDAAVFEGELSGLAILERRTGRCRRDREQRAIASSAAAKTAGMTEPVAIEPPEIGPGGKRRIAEHDFDFVERDAEFLGARAGRGSCRCRCRCLACRRRRGPCRRRGAGHWPRREIARRSRCSRPCPSRASGHRASSSRPPACASTSRIFPRRARSTRANVVTKTGCLATRRSSARSHAELHRIDLELIGQLVHGGFGRIEAGHRAGAAHAASGADIALRAAERDAKVRHTVT